MRHPTLVGVLVSLASFTVAAFAAPVRLRSEYLENPLGLDTPTPHLSWQSDSTERNWRQSAYQILVASSPDRLAQPDVWDSGKIDSGASVGIRYRGPALESRKRYYWRVRTWDGAGNQSQSTEQAWWEMGLLEAADWHAKWIHWKNPEDEADRASIHWIWLPGEDPLKVAPKQRGNFRLTFNLSGKVERAALVTAVQGSFLAKVNGREVDSKHDWSAFDWHDISDDLRVGENTVEIAVTAPESPGYGPDAGAKVMKTGLAGFVKITEAGGRTMRFPSDEKWQASSETSPVWRPAQVVGNLEDQNFSDPGPLPEPAAHLRRHFTLAKTVEHARLYATALGSYRVFLNGSRVGDDVLTPGFTDYRKRVLYQAYDVSSLLTSGDNVISALLADGWYGSPLTWFGIHFFAPPVRFMAQLEIQYSDGTRETILTDGSWKAAPSPILWSEIYAGETYDARQEEPGWRQTGFDDSPWESAAIADAPAITVSSQLDQPVRVVQTLKPKSVTAVGNGAYVFDMAQNMVGWVRLKVKGDAGSRVRLRFAERLNPDGTIYTENLRNAEATDVYILKGGPEESYAPHFTFHGFRYVEVRGYPGTPTLDAIQGDVVSSVGRNPAAKLTVASDLVNHMWEIGLWGQRGNFLSVPTDCPQRDERLGWMGDAAVFWRTGSYNFDIAAFSEKFIQDIVDAQTPRGAFTNVSPNTLPFSGGGTEGTSPWQEGLVGAPGWGDAGVIVPWTTWMQYGDKSAIEKNWEAMQHWMEFIQSRNPDFLRKNGVGPNFGDWLAPDPNTDKDLLATAYWALIAHMMSDMSHATGKNSDASRYDELGSNIRTAFQRAYIRGDGTVGTGTETSYVVALYTKMAPASLEPAMVSNLVKDIERRNWHLSTGFLGTPFLLFVLADHGHTDVAYRLLLTETYPSWGYMLSKGATTWWERWNGDTGDPAMNSYNHYAFGSVMAWVYRYAAGIDTTPQSPGFKEIIIHPHLDSRMSSARAEYESVYGKIISDWKGTPAGPFGLRVTIPANTTAQVYLPVIPGARVTEDGNPIEAKSQGESYVLRIGSGTYSFEVK